MFIPELLPESPGDVVLQPGSSQVAKDDLQVAQHPDVVLLPVLRLAGRLVVKLVVVAEHLVTRVHITLRQRRSTHLREVKSGARLTSDRALFRLDEEVCMLMDKIYADGYGMFFRFLPVFRQ